MKKASIELRLRKRVKEVSHLNFTQFPFQTRHKGTVCLFLIHPSIRWYKSTSTIENGMEIEPKPVGRRWKWKTWDIMIEDTRRYKKVESTYQGNRPLDLPLFIFSTHSHLLIIYFRRVIFLLRAIGNPFRILFNRHTEAGWSQEIQTSCLAGWLAGWMAAGFVCSAEESPLESQCIKPDLLFPLQQVCSWYGLALVPWLAPM